MLDLYRPRNNDRLRHKSPRRKGVEQEDQATGWGLTAPASPRAFWIAPQIFCGVRGMSRCAMPNGASASRTACTIVGGAPIEPHSPIPFTPRGLMGDGVSWTGDLKAGSESAGC